MPAKRKKLRSLLKSQRILRLVGAYDALTAKLVEKAGFEGVWASGLEISGSAQIPDASLLTLTEFLDAADRINDAVDIPVIADCESGFGESRNVVRMVHEYERHGITGVCIEDNEFPKTNSYAAGQKRLASKAHFVDKIRAAVDTRRDQSFAIFARTEAFIVGEECSVALDRALAYEAAGADAIVVQSRLNTIHQISKFANAWSQGQIPLVVIPTKYPQVRLVELEDLGVRGVIFANVIVRSTIHNLKRVLKTLSEENTLAAIKNDLCSLQTLFDLQGEYYERLGAKEVYKEASDITANQ